MSFGRPGLSSVVGAVARGIGRSHRLQPYPELMSAQNRADPLVINPWLAALLYLAQAGLGVFLAFTSLGRVAPESLDDASRPVSRAPR